MTLGLCWPDEGVAPQSCDKAQSPKNTPPRLCECVVSRHITRCHGVTGPHATMWPTPQPSTWISRNVPQAHQWTKSRIGCPYATSAASGNPPPRGGEVTPAPLAIPNGSLRTQGNIPSEGSTAANLGMEVWETTRWHNEQWGRQWGVVPGDLKLWTLVGERTSRTEKSCDQ